MAKILLIFGTRPELIKLAPVIHEFERRKLRNSLIVINSNQHRTLVHDILEDFNVTVDYTLDIDNTSNNLSVLASEIMRKLELLIGSISQEDAIGSMILQGDTSTGYCASVVAFYNKIAVHYIEAGLRTYDNSKPFPEEFHRRVISHTAAFLYAPTQSTRENLLAEGFPAGKIMLTGNTVIDSIQLIERIKGGFESKPEVKTILCTMHRRENQDGKMGKYLDSILTMASLYPEFKFVIIRHPNPKVKQVLDSYMPQLPSNLVMINPVPYSEMLKLLYSSRLIISDSGGLQEEASYFMKPIIVLRTSTERVDSIEKKIAVCIDVDREDILPVFVKMLNLKMDDSHKYLYGSGKASEMIVNNVLSGMQ